VTGAATTRLTVALVGAGPGGTVLLERLLANAAALAPGRPLDIHVVDPYPPGGGRVWRRAQPALLWMNSIAADVTMFTDDSVAMDGPVRPGPTLCAWSDQAGAGLTPGAFPSRPVLNDYLSWCFEYIVSSAPQHIAVQVHRAQAVDLTDGPGAQQLLWLDGRDAPLTADAVILAQGHLPVAPAAEYQELADFAGRHALRYLPPHYAADADLDVVAAGEPVIMRGMGLGFIDDMVLLTGGRGGRFSPGADGRLTYHPSGREPIMYAGSRRGVPYHSKITYQLQGERLAGPQFFTPAVTADLYARRGPLDLRRELWPLIAKELGRFYYHELFTAHGDRVTMGWTEFLACYARHEWGSDALADLVEASVPKADDRLDFDRLLDPLAARDLGDGDDLQDSLRDYIASNVARHGDPAHSADLGLFNGLLVTFGVLLDAVNSGRLTARSHAEDLGGWFRGVFSYYASGPPPQRLRELVALSRAGVVRFLGPGIEVTTDPARGVFRASGTQAPGHVEARALIESRLPAATMSRARDPLIGVLYARGDITEESLADGDGRRYPLGKLRVREPDLRLVDAAATVHPRRFALGAWVGQGFTIAGFTRPRTNAISFRIADRLARTVLSEIAEAA
jgi:FAD-NAD(P)-binding